MNIHKSFYQVCAVGIIAGTSAVLPIPLALKGIILFALLVALLVIKPDKED